jgi:hypothetical protein
MAYRDLLGRLGLAAALLAFAGCSSDDSDDSGDDSGGASSGATGGASGSAGTGSGGSAGTGGAAPSVDCPALCESVRTLCGADTIDDNWVSVCTSACDARVRVAPETAELEDGCVRAAPDCTTAVLCVASPTGSGGSGG